MSEELRQAVETDAYEFTDYEQTDVIAPFRDENLYLDYEPFDSNGIYY